MTKLADRFPDYVSGLLTEAERSEFEAALAGATPDELAELRAYDEVAVRLFENAAEPVEPSPATNARVLAAIRDQAGVAEPLAELKAGAASDQGRSGGRWWTWLPLAASLAALSWAGYLYADLRASRAQIAELEAEQAAVAADFADFKNELARTQAQLTGLGQELSTLVFPQRRTVVLAGLESAPTASATAIVRSTPGDAAFRAFGLPQLEAGQTYQLWYILASGPVSAGTFGVDQQGDGQILVSGLPSQSIAAWAVSIEPEGGVPQPTGSIVLQG